MYHRQGRKESYDLAFCSICLLCLGLDRHILPDLEVDIHWRSASLADHAFLGRFLRKSQIPFDPFHIFSAAMPAESRREKSPSLCLIRYLKITKTAGDSFYTAGNALTFLGMYRFMFRIIWHFGIEAFRGSFLHQTCHPNTSLCSHAFPEADICLAFIHVFFFLSPPDCQIHITTLMFIFTSTKQWQWRILSLACAFAIHSEWS